MVERERRKEEGRLKGGERECHVCFLFKLVRFHWVSKPLGIPLATSVHTCLSQVYCTRCVQAFNLGVKVEGRLCRVCEDITGLCACCVPGGEIPSVIVLVMIQDHVVTLPLNFPVCSK